MNSCSISSEEKLIKFIPATNPARLKVQKSKCKVLQGSKYGTCPCENQHECPFKECTNN